MTARTLRSTAGWLAAAVLALGVVAVVVALGRGLGGGTALSEREAAAELSAAGTPGSPPGGPTPTGTAPAAAPTVRPTVAPTAGPTAPPATRTPAPTRPTRTDPVGEARLLRAPGGTVTAACAGGRPVLLGWTPAQGWAVDEVERHDAKVRFEGPGGRSEIRVRCAGGEVRAEIRD
ncbi:hypothetical protein GCM10010123_17540 [Pilimelia anulata]|uniref:Septum formation initiator n=1 Tax=Pilimelia anulata TaxID=53371 RepID=A0A8J3B1S9_9ACTN|nr:hypothetical protein [Pilimelia anulata]GGJ88447.1 hypothetical protein GCM10010123_17540 [Pilimelia anulata]